MLKTVQTKKAIRLMGIDIKWFTLFAALVFGITFVGKLPAGMAGAAPLLFVLGAIFLFIGDRLPIIKDFFGGGAFAILFGSSALVYFGILPKYATETVTTFMNKGGFVEIALATLIVGSILGMDKKVLISASLRYLPCILAAQVIGILSVALVGGLIGYGWKEAILYVGLPAMGGGITAGATPMSKMFGQAMGQDPQAIFSAMVSAVALANAMAIGLGGLAHKIGLAKPSWTGNGNLLRSQTAKKLDEEEERANATLDLKQYGIGILASICFLITGYLLAMVVPVIHAYAFTVILAMIVKISGVMPDELEDACYLWSQLFIKNATVVILAGLGIAMIDLGAVIKALTLQYIILTGTVVITTSIGAGLIGRLIGFYPIESAITVGLCSTDMGGSGDLAILSASKRMVLLPFSSISTRLGGAIILIIAGVLVKTLI